MTTPDPFVTAPIVGSDPDRQARAIRKDKPVKVAPLERRQGVVTAVNVAGGTCTIILGDSGTEIPDVIHLSNYVPQVNDTVSVLVQGSDMYVLDRTSNLGPSVISTVQQQSVLTEDFTTSTLYEALPNGPGLSGVIVGPSGRMLVQISSLAYSQQSNTLALCGVRLIHTEFDFTVDPMAVTSQIVYSYSSAGLGVAASKVNMYQGLPPGEYTMSMMFASSSGNACYFSNRHIWAMPL